VEIFVETNKLELIPADADTEPKAAARQLVERGRLLCHQDSLPLRQDQHTNGKPIRCVQPDKKPNNTNGS
jgi:hypothetical protein